MRASERGLYAGCSEPESTHRSEGAVRGQTLGEWRCAPSALKHAVPSSRQAVLS
ncbi:hypothetical protein D187_004179 [Cystobacter fuscus DSM 2262]|uniref:Uncharacterized protein n=1 Tax=Cystobacter fuscus (strain ATCC 25194 / DSM 2262 / NBRC 100088 / M29) TaxID=1242864 RepID=S9P7G7_CYSF2|nr:hypothetical protein D187_004179 [Cystobacter fuscus DSM 2262]